MPRENVTKRRWTIAHLSHVRSRFRRDRLRNAVILSGVAKLSRGKFRASRSRRTSAPRRTDRRTELDSAKPQHGQTPTGTGPSDHGLPLERSLDSRETRSARLPLKSQETGPALLPRGDDVAINESRTSRTAAKQKRVFTDGNTSPESSPQLKRVRLDKLRVQAKGPRVTQSLSPLRSRMLPVADTSLVHSDVPIPEDPKLVGGSRDSHHHHHHHHHHRHHQHPESHHERLRVDGPRHDIKPRAVSQPTVRDSHGMRPREADGGHDVRPQFLPGSTGKAHASSSSWPSRIGRPKIKGLSNPGLWCYRRSVMQALLCLPQICRVLEYHKPCNGSCITCALSQVFEAYHRGDNLRRQVQTLDKVIASTGRRSDPPWKHTGHSQEDAHMFLQYLVGNIETARGMPGDRFRHAILIQHVASWTCQGCKKVHHHTDPPSCSLQLPIAQSRDKQTTLEHCLDHYHREEDLTIRCDACKTNRPRTRQHRIKHPPDVLTIQLKRFQTSLTGRGVQKNSRRVRIDSTFDLSPWCAGERKSRYYRLQAVVAHSGSLNMGHYVAYVRHQDQIKLVNDETVSTVASSEWVSPRAYDPYILVYTRT